MLTKICVFCVTPRKKMTDFVFLKHIKKENESEQIDGNLM